MHYASEHLVAELKRARTRAGLSQRALASQSGVTQGHISQIENGITEPGLGALIDLSRALDLEVMLIPRKRVAAVSAVVEEGPLPPGQDPYVRQAFERAETALRRATERFGSTASTDRLRESIALLRHATLTVDDADSVLKALGTLGRLDRSDEPARRLREAAETLWSIRTRMVHGRHGMERGAYSLAEEEDAGG